MVEALTDSLMCTFSGEGRRPVGDQIVELASVLANCNTLMACILLTRWYSYVLTLKCQCSVVQVQGL